jgi:hypothetical protein
MMMRSRRLSTWILLRDRRRAAIHEAGHFTIGRHLGLLTFNARIEKNPIQSRDEKSWIGSAYILPSTTLRKNRMVAVAGADAEFCWDREMFEDTQFDWEDPDIMSETDWARSGCQPGEPSRQLMRAVESTFELFDPTEGQLWSTLLRKARDIIVDSRE